MINYSGDKLARTVTQFQDSRLDELLFRYRARNFPDSLSVQETERWDRLRASRFFEGDGQALTVDDFFADIDRLSGDASPHNQALLASLYDYAESIVPDRH